jgi:hypothetical protein
VRSCRSNTGKIDSAGEEISSVNSSEEMGGGRLSRGKNVERTSRCVWDRCGLRCHSRSRNALVRGMAGEAQNNCGIKDGAYESRATADPGFHSYHLFSCNRGSVMGRILLG